MENVAVALISAVFGGFGIKVIEYLLVSRKTQLDGNVTIESKKIDDGVLMRQEYREDLKHARSELAKLYAQAEQDQKAYFELKEKYLRLQLRYNDIEKELETIKRKET